MLLALAKCSFHISVLKIEITEFQLKLNYSLRVRKH